MLRGIMKEFWVGSNVVGFDGSVIEIFGAVDVHRYHLYHIQSIEVSRSRKGRLSLQIFAQGGRGMPSLGGFDDSALPAIEELVEAVNSARNERGWEPVPFK